MKATDAEIRTGLLGYLSITVGGFVLDGLTLRRTSGGRLRLSFPWKTDRAGRRHRFVDPVNEQVRREIEAAILGQISDQPLEGDKD